MKLKIETVEATLEEKKRVLAMVRKINAKRRRSNMPRLQYEIKLG